MRRWPERRLLSDGQVSRARSREMDLAIAACAITQDAALWTLNEEDFRDIPGLKLA